MFIYAPRGLGKAHTGGLTVCAGGKCERAAFDGPGSEIVHVPIDATHDGQPATAELVMPDGSRYTARAELEVRRPNGPSCEPECIQAELHLTRVRSSP